jgi:hypothetical protein
VDRSSRLCVSGLFWGSLLVESILWLDRRTVISGGFLPMYANKSSVAVAVHHMTPTAQRNLGEEGKAHETVSLCAGGAGALHALELAKGGVRTPQSVWSAHTAGAGAASGAVAGGAGGR